MKRSALIILFLLLALYSWPSIRLSSLAQASAGSAAACAYCGWYFVFGDTKPFSECFDRVQACFKESGRMSGDSVATCLCKVQRELSQKYNKPEAMKGIVDGADNDAGPIGGGGLPTTGFTKAKLQKRLEDAEMPAEEFLKTLLGDYASPTIDNSEAILGTSEPMQSPEALASPQEIAADAVDAIFGGSGDFILTYFDLDLPEPGSKEAKESISLNPDVTSTGNHAQALIDEIPSDANEFAKFMESISPLDFESLNAPPEPKNKPEEVESPLEPGSDASREIPSGELPSREFKTEYTLKSGDITFTLPNGEVRHGYRDDNEFISLPAGTKITTDRFGSSYLSLSRSNGQPVGVSMLWDSEIEIVEVDPYGGIAKIKVNKGFARFYPREPIKVEDFQGIEITNQETDFGVAADPITKTTIVEIYDGKIEVESELTKRTLETKYGSEIKRIEIEKNSQLEEKIAIPKSQWKAFLADQKKIQMEKSHPESPAKGSISLTLMVSLALVVLTFLATIILALLHQRNKS